MTVTSGSSPDVAHRDAAAARFHALAEVGRVGTGPASAVLARAAEAARAALGAASASISVFEPDKSQVRCLVNVGDLGPGEVPEPEDEVYSLLEYGSLALLIDGQRGLVCTLGQETRLPDFERYLASLGKGSCISVPIPLDGRVWGELFVTRHTADPPFDGVDLDFALAVAAQVGAALATADHVRRVQQLAYTDALTGLANRRAVDEWMDHAFAKFAIDGTAVGLLVCDLNGLKQINDEQGHDAGDRALIRFTGLLTRVAVFVPGAIVGRLGGDEFCIAVSGADPDHLVAAAEELCRLVLRSPLEGVSCGVASTAEDTGPVESPSRLFRLADAAQYRAKRSRSARPVVAGRSLPPEAAVRLAEHPLHRADRRAVRGRDRVDVGRLLVAGLDTLDDLREAEVAERLAAVADCLALRTDALGWWVSVAPAGAGCVRTIRFSMIRTHPGTATGPGSSAVIGTEFALADYPITSAVLGGGAAVVHVDDPDADPGEVAILDGLGGVAVAEAGFTTPDGTGWLVEVMGDELSAPMTEIPSVLRSLVLVAVIEAQSAEPPAPEAAEPPR